MKGEKAVLDDSCKVVLADDVADSIEKISKTCGFGSVKWHAILSQVYS